MTNHNMTIVDDRVQEIFDHFCHSFQIRALLYDREGSILVEGLKAHNSAYCSLLRNELKLEQLCIACDRKNMEKARKSGKLIVYTCHCGLLEAIYPIHVKGKHMGYAMIGQIRQSDFFHPVYSALWKERFHNDVFEKSFSSLPTYSRSKIQHILGLFTPLMDYIVEHEFITSQQHILVDKLLEYLHLNADRAVSMKEVSVFIKKSPSTITHTIKELTGMSFKEFCIDYRIKQGEKLMQKHPEMTIREIADKTGYSDPFYFSRIFKKYRGKAPTYYLHNNDRKETRLLTRI
jgi:AraC-like DNA-binding protein/ligand-binding sensor protein